MRVAVALLVLAWSCVPQAQAQTQVQTEPGAQAWLRRINDAAHKLSFTGTFVYQGGGRTETSRITRYADGLADLEKIEVMDGTPREVLRDGDVVRCYFPETRTVKVERWDGRRAFPALLADEVGRLADRYTIRLGRTGRVAGYSCQEVVLNARDEFRYSFRLWADTRSGMLMKASVLDERGGVVEQFMFTQLKLGGVTAATARMPPDNGRWRIEEGATVATDLSREGWQIQPEVVGYHKLAEVRRAFGADRSAAQVVYTDGLGAVSVFIESSSNFRDAAQPGIAASGARRLYMRELGGFRVTAVGDAPSASVRRIAESVVYRGP